MKALSLLTASLFLLLLSFGMVSAQTSSNLSTEDISQLREERSVYLFNMQNKHDIEKQKNMGEAYEANVEKADLNNKRREIQIVEDSTFPKYVEMNDAQKASWEYAQAKKAWIAANPEGYAALQKGASAQ